MQDKNLINNFSNYENNEDFKRDSLMVSLYNIFNDSIRLLAKKNNVYLIDLAKLLPTEQKYFYDNMHFNSEGSVLVANIVSDALIEAIKNDTIILKNDN